MGFRQRERLLLIGVVLCLAALGGDRFVLSPLARKWKAQSESIARLQKNLDKGATLVERKEQLDERWADMRHNSLPNDPAAAEKLVLNAINDWARRASVSIRSLKPRWTFDEKAPPEIECRIEASGDMESLARFLHALEGSSMALRAHDVEISARDERGRNLTLSLRFTGIILPEDQG